MKEVRRYSNHTVKLAARHVRRAARQLPSNLGTRARLELLVEHLVRLGLEPADVARPSGADALLAIVTTVDPDQYQHGIDTETRKRATATRNLVVDSFSGEEPKMQSHVFASFNYSALEQQIAARIAKLAPKLSPPWQRVIDCAMRMPDAP